MKNYITFLHNAHLLVSGVVAILMVGCRTVPESAALAQVPNGRDDRALTAEEAGEGIPDVSVRRVWAGSYLDFVRSSISPDGRYMSQVDHHTMDLAVRDLQTGELHRLTNVQRGPGRPYEDAGVSVFSRDGRKLVVGWQYAPDLQLRVLDFALDANGVPIESEPTVIFHNAAFYPYFPFDWSPDGRRVLAKVYTRRYTSSQLALISVSDGTYRALKSFDWREPTMAEFSPDGRYIAYDFMPDDDSDDRDVFVVSVDGTYEGRVVRGPAVDRLLGWHPDGHILFHSDRGGTPGIWRVATANGRANGPPELVKADVWNAQPLGFAGTRFYYAVDATRHGGVHSITVDFASGRVTEAPQLIAQDPRIRISGWDWSPDGEFLAYSAGMPGSQGSLIGIHGANGEEIRRISLDLARSVRIRWHPDGKSVVTFTRDAKGRRGFYQIDLETGDYTTILRTDVMEEKTGVGNFALSPDGTTLYYARKRGDFTETGRQSLVAVNLESGDTRQIAVVRSVQAPLAVSPDGSRLAFPGFTTDGEWEIGTVSVTGGSVTRLEGIAEGVYVADVEWTPDGQWIYYTGLDPQLKSYARVVAADGSVRRQIEFPDGVEPGKQTSVHPDARRIAILWNGGPDRGEVWVMEGLGASEPGSAHAQGAR